MIVWKLGFSYSVEFLSVTISVHLGLSPAVLAGFTVHVLMSVSLDLNWICSGMMFIRSMFSSETSSCNKVGNTVAKGGACLFKMLLVQSAGGS